MGAETSAYHILRQDLKKITTGSSVQPDEADDMVE